MAPLTLTILGAGPAAPNAGGACSGYLVQDADNAVLVDCGNGRYDIITKFDLVTMIGGFAETRK